MRACPRVRHARGLRARAHYAARDGWRARARAQIYCRGCGSMIPIPARILPVAIFIRVAWLAGCTKLYRIKSSQEISWFQAN